MQISGSAILLANIWKCHFINARVFYLESGACCKYVTKFFLPVVNLAQVLSKFVKVFLQTGNTVQTLNLESSVDQP